MSKLGANSLFLSVFRTGQLGKIKILICVFREQFFYMFRFTCYNTIFTKTFNVGLWVNGIVPAVISHIVYPPEGGVHSIFLQKLSSHV